MEQSNTPTAVFLKQDHHLFYKLQTGRVTAVNTERKHIKQTVCVPAIYANKLQVISEVDFEEAIKSTGLQ